MKNTNVRLMSKGVCVGTVTVIDKLSKDTWLAVAIDGHNIRFQIWNLTKGDDARWYSDCYKKL